MMSSGFRIAIVGVGQVGGAAAYALIQKSIATELVLVDTEVVLRDGQVRDLSDAAHSSNSDTRVRGATLHEAGQCDMIIVTAGSKYNIGQTSLQLLYRNISKIKTIINGMTPFKKDTILLIVSNPVDLLTSIAYELSGLPKSQVLGSGTFLDSVRLRGLVADQTGTPLHSIDLHVLGVHGESQVVAWSAAKIGDVPMDSSLAQENRTKLEEECKHRSQEIIRAKGAIPFGMASTISEVCSAIALDTHTVAPVSHFMSDLNCCLSLPVVLGRQGIVSEAQVLLDEREEAAMASAARDLRLALDRVHGK
ncbi:L-lactate/malate dehydrogenase [Thozetella sp. PMI_491]|nr:L-lactate/malate dehydrogenase [Thozetella sp. PMI_491]